MRGAWTSGSGTGVVLLHSSLSSAAQWRPLAGELENRYRVMAVDLLGYGDAPAVPDPEAYRLADEHRRIVALADAAFGRGAPFHLVGHSFGGQVALSLAREHPSRVLSLAAYEPVCFNLVPDGDPDLGLLRKVAATVAMHVRAGRLYEATRLFFDYWNGPHALSRLPAAAQGRLVHDIVKVPLDFQACFHEPRAAQHYGRLAIPALLVGGNRSPRLTRSIVETLARAMPSAAVAWVDGGHMAPIEAPAPFHRMLHTFLDWTAPLAQAA